MIRTSGASWPAAAPALVLMHMRGTAARDVRRGGLRATSPPRSRASCAERLALAAAAGVPRDAIIVDPGLGFAKRAEHSYEVLARLAGLAVARPAAAGRHVAQVVPDRARSATVPPAERDWGTAASRDGGDPAGAHIVRVHAVGEMVQVVRVADEIGRHGRLTRGSSRASSATRPVDRASISIIT